MKRSLLLLFFVAVSPLFAADPSSRIRGTRALGMGDAVTALADDQNVFFYNPAGSVQRTGSLFNFVEVAVTANKDAVDFYTFVQDNKKSLQDYDTLPPDQQILLVNKIKSEMVGLNAAFGVTAPNLCYLSGPIGGSLHWGAGFFGQMSGQAGFNPIVLVPTLYYDVHADALGVGTLSYRFKKLPFLPGSFGVGGQVKSIRRGRIREKSLDVFTLENYDAPPVQQGRGVGMDFGTLYQPTPRWKVALSVSDFGGTKIRYDAKEAEKGYPAQAAHSEKIPAQWNTGVAWTPGRVGVESFGIALHDRLLLSADVRNIADKDSQIFSGGGLADTAGTHIHLGAEYRWWFLRFRTGANQGYWTGGLGVDLPFLKFDYAYYSDELSPFAGTSRSPAHRVSFTLGWGSGKTETREQIKHKK